MVTKSDPVSVGVYCDNIIRKMGGDTLRQHPNKERRGCIKETKHGDRDQGKEKKFPLKREEKRTQG